MKYLIIMCALLTGCAHSKRTTPYEPREAPPSKALLYVYRSPTSIHSANPDVPSLYVNDKYIGKMMIRGHYAIEVEPGNTLVYFKDSLFLIPIPWKTLKKAITTEPGKKYYLKFSVEFIAGRSIRQVHEKQGELELKETPLLVP